MTRFLHNLATRHMEGQQAAAPILRPRPVSRFEPVRGAGPLMAPPTRDGSSADDPLEVEAEVAAPPHRAPRAAAPTPTAPPPSVVPPPVAPHSVATMETASPDRAARAPIERAIHSVLTESDTRPLPPRSEPVRRTTDRRDTMEALVSPVTPPDRPQQQALPTPPTPAPAIATAHVAPETRVVERVVLESHHDTRIVTPAGKTPDGAAPRPVPTIRPLTTLAPVRPASQPREQEETPAAADAPPVIHVTIGRIDIRASVAAPARAEKSRATPPVMSLEDYLRHRAGGDRR